MRVFQGVSELSEAVGTHLGYSDWLTITQQDIDAFADVTGDRQWIHVDPVRAADGPFGATIAHGYLTLSLVPKLVWQIYEVAGFQMGVNYGANKVRFPAPTPVNSKIRAGVELVSVAPSAAGAQVVARVSVEREGGTKPVCVVDTVSVFIE